MFSVYHGVCPCRRSAYDLYHIYEYFFVCVITHIDDREYKNSRHDDITVVVLFVVSIGIKATLR